jgi:hypothetical protein
MVGFNVQDISASFEATLSKSIDDHLDWVKEANYLQVTQTNVLTHLL